MFYYNINNEITLQNRYCYTTEYSYMRKKFNERLKQDQRFYNLNVKT